MAYREDLYREITTHPEYPHALAHGLTPAEFRALVEHIRPPTAPPAEPGRDQIDPASVRWLHTNVSTWPIASELTRVTMRDSQVCLYHSQAGRWPVRDGVEGNPWVFARFGGIWHAATYEWLRPGQVCKGVTRSGERSIGRHTKRPPFPEWVPASGEDVGWMVSGLARDAKRNIQARTQIVLTTWPQLP